MILNKIMCGNRHEIAITSGSAISAKDITHKKLIGKYENGDVFKRCPDCNSTDIIVEYYEKPEKTGAA